MYHLIVTAQARAWDGKPYTLEISRAIREYTDDVIEEKYKALDEVAIRELQSFPALFAYEAQEKSDARLGFIKRIKRRSDEVRIEYEFFPDLPAIPASALSDLTWELDIGNWEMNRTHWAVKAVDLFSVLVEAGLITNEQASRLPAHLVKTTQVNIPGPLTITPTAFSIVNQNREADLVSVMMPFDAAFSPVYSAIQRASTEAVLRCLRADDIWQESAVIQDIANLLYRSQIVVVDFSGRNANVMYETGIAHTLGRPVVPISQSLDDVPFDLRQHRVLKYLPNNEGLTEMQSSLAKRLKTLTDHAKI